MRLLQFIHVHPRRLSLRLRDRPTLWALANRLIVDPILDDKLELGAQVRAVERILADDHRLLVLS